MTVRALQSRNIVAAGTSQIVWRMPGNVQPALSPGEFTVSPPPGDGVSYDVASHVLDAESGSRTATAAIHVKDQDELKLRVGELAHQMGMSPDEQKQVAKQGQQTEKALADAKAALGANDPNRAARIAIVAITANNSRSVNPRCRRGPAMFIYCNLCK